MKKKIKDITIGEYCNICRKHTRCTECPLNGNCHFITCDLTDDFTNKVVLEKEVEVDD